MRKLWVSAIAGAIAVPALALAPLVTASASTSPAPRAAAPAELKIGNAFTRPATAVLFGAHATRVAVDVRITGTAVQDVSATLAATAGADTKALPHLHLISGTHRAGLWQGFAWFNRHDETGAWTITVTAKDRDGSASDKSANRLHVKLDTFIFDLDARPRPVRRGHLLTLSGGIRKLDPAHGYVAFAGAPIAVFFQPTHGSIRFVGITRSGSAGHFTTVVRDWQSGTWKVIYLGNPLYAATLFHNVFVRVL